MYIGVDLDGTLAEYKGYQGANHIGPLLPGARDWLEALVQDGHKVLIFTARGNDPDGLKATREWIVREGIAHLITDITGSKLYLFDLFVDDRAVRFEGSYPDIAMLTATKPWWRTK